MTKTFLTTIFLRSSQFVNDIKYEFLTRMHIPNFKNVLRRKLRGGPQGILFLIFTRLNHVNMPKLFNSPLKLQIRLPQMTECICGYRNGTTKIANDGVNRSAEKGNIP